MPTPTPGPNRRIDHHGAVERGPRVTVTVDGESLGAFEGETLAAAMLAAGRRTFRKAPRSGTPRGVFCGMGVCYDCLMVVDGRPNVRACMTPVVDGMIAAVQEGPSAGVRPTPAWDAGDDPALDRLARPSVGAGPGADVQGGAQQGASARPGTGAQHGAGTDQSNGSRQGGA